MTDAAPRMADLLHAATHRQVGALVGVLAGTAGDGRATARAQRLLAALWRRAERTAPTPTQMAPALALSLWMAAPPHLDAFLFSLPGFADSLDMADGMEGTMYHLFDAVVLAGWWGRHGEATVAAKLQALPSARPPHGWPGLHALAWKLLLAERPTDAHRLWPVFGHGARLPQAALVWTLGNGPLPCAHLALDALPCTAPAPQDLEDADTVVGQIRVWCAMMARRPHLAHTSTSNVWMRMLTADTCLHRAQIFADTGHAALRRAALLGAHTPHGWIDALTLPALAQDRSAKALDRAFEGALTQAFGAPPQTPRPAAPTDPYAVYTAAPPLPQAPSHP